MALIQLVNETKLKSLKFGNDRPGGGSSTEPFIQSNIPQANSGNIPLALATTTSILAKLPGVTDPGIGLATYASLVDTARLSKFFATPQGLVFIAKQNVLSRIGARTQASGLLNFLNNDVYTSTNTIAQAGVNVFGGHLDKQGLKPFEGLGKDYTPGQYIDAIRTGIRPQLTFGPRTVQLTRGRQVPGQIPGFSSIPTQYIKPPKTVSLKKAPSITTENVSDRLINLLGDTLDNTTSFLFKYRGGPGSQFGIGDTTIKFATDRIGVNLRTGDSDRYTIRNSGNAVWENTQIFEVPDAVDPYKPTIQKDFRKALRDYYAPLNAQPVAGRLIPSTSMAATLAPNYEVNGQTNIEARVNLNNPAAPGRNLTDYVTGTSTNTYDRINAFPLYRSEIIPKEYGPKVNDLVKFRIAAIDNDNPTLNEYIHFRAFLGNITDNYSGQWDSVEYMGRGDKLYHYKGFTRTISLSWIVAAQSKQELIPMYQKLNFLASNLAPDYNNIGYMRGPLINLTIGGYLYEVPGFITGMSLEMSEEYPWEIGIGNNDELYSEDRTVKELSQIIKVSSFNFTPIHRFIPRKQVNTYGDGIETEDDSARFLAPGSTQKTAALPGQGGQSVGPVTAFGSTRFISLDVGSHNNYDKDLGVINPDSM